MKKEHYQTLCEARNFIKFMKPHIWWHKGKIETSNSFDKLPHWNSRSLRDTMVSLRGEINGIRVRARTVKPSFKQRLTQSIDGSLRQALDRHRPSLSPTSNIIPCGEEPSIDLTFTRHSRYVRFNVGLAWGAQVYDRLYQHMDKNFGQDFIVLRARRIGATHGFTLFEVRNVTISKVEDQKIHYLDGYMAVDFMSKTWGVGTTVTTASKSLDRMNARFVAKRLKEAA